MSYPGQCVHTWAGPARRQACTQCGATCERDPRGMITDYTNVAAIREEPRRVRRP